MVLLDNCSAHPDERELVSDNTFIGAKFLPPIVTSIVQPIDQNLHAVNEAKYLASLLQTLPLSERIHVKKLY